jgi:type I restriction enzyme S subunit
MKPLYTGLRNTISKENFFSFKTYLPPLSEQEKIAQFLDDKTTKIDKAITIKQQQIELLKERRQILIHQAVTKGINPKIKLKDSGVEWIGEIPVGWEVPKLKYVCLFILDGTHGSYERVNNGYRLLSVRNIINNKFVFRDDDSMVSTKHFKEISAKFLISNGDIQLAIVGATLGKVALVEDLKEEIVTQRSLSTIRVNNKILNIYLFYFLQSDLFQSFLWNNTGFSAQPRIYLGTIQNVNIPLPSLLDQQEIVNYIETATTKIATAIQLKEQEIEKLKEYKSSLINDVVTGKVKIGVDESILN